MSVRQRECESAGGMMVGGMAILLASIACM